jgi:hypothetical protein
MSKVSCFGCLSLGFEQMIAVEFAQHLIAFHIFAVHGRFYDVGIAKTQIMFMRENYEIFTVI